MADSQIYLTAGELSGKNIDKAASSLLKLGGYGESSLFAEVVHSFRYKIKNHYNSRFLSLAGDEAELIAAEIQSIGETLSGLKKCLSDGPAKIEAADKEFKGFYERILPDGRITEKQSFWEKLFGIPPSVITTITRREVPPCAPPESIDIHDYKQGVERGTIRYCNQNPYYYSDNGWKEKDAISCGGQCNRACESMAFSYLGIDVSPSDMGSAPFNEYEIADKEVREYVGILPTGDGSTATVEIKGVIGFNQSVLDECVSDYMNDNGKGVYSPVMLRYAKSGGAHWINIIGKNKDGSYLAIGPWSNNGTDYERIPFNVMIDENGIVSGNGFSGADKGRSVVRMGQYIRTN